MVKKILISNNIRNIRAQTKNLSLELLEEIHQKLGLIIEERRKINEQAQEDINNYNQKIATYLQLIKKDGIEINDLLKKADFPTFKRLRKSRAPRPPKYKYYDQSGDLKTWTGQGRMPKPIQQALNANEKKSLEDFLI